MKNCKKCEKELENECFYKHPKSKDGLFSNCKACVKEVKYYNYKHKIRIVPKEKRCSLCKKDFPISFFYGHGTGKNAQCKWCVCRKKKQVYKAQVELLLPIREIKIQLKKSNVFTNFSI